MVWYSALALLGNTIFGWFDNSLEDWDGAVHGWKFWKAIQPIDVKKLILTLYRQVPVYLGMLGISTLVFGGVQIDTVNVATALLSFVLHKTNVYRLTR